MPAVLDRPLPALDPLSQAATAARGAAWLDGVVPGWADKINLDNFTIASSHKCVLGQLHGSYHAGVDRLSGALLQVDVPASVRGWRKDLPTYDATVWLGFHRHIDRAPFYCGQLDEAWRREISGRR